MYTGADLASIIDTNSTDLDAADRLFHALEAARARGDCAFAGSLQEVLDAKFGLVVDESANGILTLRRLRSRCGRVDLEEGREIRSLAKAASRAAADAAFPEVDSAAQRAKELLSDGEEGVMKLQGRSHADVALDFALAGAGDPELFLLLAGGMAKELDRFGARAKPLVVALMIERLALAGVRQCEFPAVFDRARRLLWARGWNAQESTTLRDLEAGNFSLLSERPLLCLFRHETRRGSRSVPPRGADAATRAIERLNLGASRACAHGQRVVLDLGCGYGVSSLGLGLFGEYQVLAVDASAQYIHFARSMAARWRVPPGRLRFVHCSAQAALQATEHGYGGLVEWILINFPTPYAVQWGDSQESNSCLPKSADSPDFMVSQELLDLAWSCLRAKGTPSAALLLQSNVEDVAVHLRAVAEASGWEAVTDGSLGPEITEPPTTPRVESEEQWLPRRQLSYARSGGRRAAGPGWLRRSPLPPAAATETERYYEGAGLPVYRVALRPHICK